MPKSWQVNCPAVAGIESAINIILVSMRFKYNKPITTGLKILQGITTAESLCTL